MIVSYKLPYLANKIVYPMMAYRKMQSKNKFKPERMTFQFQLIISTEVRTNSEGRVHDE